MDPKKQLQQLIKDLETKKFRDGEAKGLVQTIGGEIQNQLKPAFEGLAKELKTDMASAFKEAVNSIKVDMPEMPAPQIHVTVPDVIVPDITVPEPKVTINVPKADTPIVNVAPADVHFPSEMNVVGDTQNPVPVVLYGADKKPFTFSFGGVGGGKADFWTIKDIQNSSGGSLIDNDGNLKVAGSFSAVAASSVSLVNADGSYYNSDNPFPVTFSSSTQTTQQLSGAADSVNVISSITLDVKQLSGSTDSVIVNSGTLTAVTSITNSVAAAIVDSTGVAYSGSNPLPAYSANTFDVKQLSGSVDSVSVTGFSTSIAASMVDSSGVQYSGSNPLPVGGTVAVSGVTASVQSSIIDSSGVQYSGSNPFPVYSANTFDVKQLSGSIDSVSVTGFSTSIGASLLNGDGSAYDARDRNWTITESVPVVQVSGVAFSVSVTDVFGSTGANVINPDGRIKVELPTGSSGLTDTELRASHLDVQQVSGAVFSVVVNSVLTSIATNMTDSSGVAYSGSNPVPVSIVSGAGSTTSVVGDVVNGGDDLNSLPIKIGGRSDSGSPTAVSSGQRVNAWFGLSGEQVATINPQGSTTNGGDSLSYQSFRTVGGAGIAEPLVPMFAFNGTNFDRVRNYAGEGNAIRVQMANDAVASVSITGASGTIAASITDSSGVQYSGSNPLPVTFTGSSSTSVSLVNAQGTYYNSDNPLPSALYAGTTPLGNGGSGDGTTPSSSLASMMYAMNGTNMDRIHTGSSGYDEAGALRTAQATNSVSSVNLVSSVALVVTSITNTTASNLVDSSGIVYSGSNPFPVTFTGSSSTSVSLVNSQGTYYNSDNPFFVTTGASGLNETNANVMRVVHMTDTALSTVINSGTLTAVTSVTNSVQVVNLDRDGNPWAPYVFGTGDAGTALRVLVAGNSDVSTVVNSGTLTAVTSITNTVPVMQVSGNIDSMFVTGVADSSFIYQARQTNPTPLADGADARPRTDDLGRQLTRPHQVRDLLATFYTTLSTGTETTILTAAAGTYLDPLLITATNTSTAAIQVDLRAVSGGNIVMTWMIPASTGPIGLQLPTGWPQDATGNAWTADMGDFTNTNVYLSGLMSKEV
jgi:hypothetical protein